LFAKGVLKYIKNTVSGFRELLSAVNANNAENAGVRGANANNRGANTNTNYGFPLNHYGFAFLQTIHKPRNHATQRYKRFSVCIGKRIRTKKSAGRLRMQFKGSY
jgi:hypothetical protein